MSNFGKIGRGILCAMLALTIPVLFAACGSRSDRGSASGEAGAKGQSADSRSSTSASSASEGRWAGSASASRNKWAGSGSGTGAASGGKWEGSAGSWAPKGEDREKEHNTESYGHIVDNGFVAAGDSPLSTFAIDVDTASYSNMRRFLNDGRLPPKDAVRIEEIINYFPYTYAPPQQADNAPFATHTEIASCPWNAEHKLVRIGLKGKVLSQKDRPALNLVFLIDVSGSMNEPNRLPLVKRGLSLLVPQLQSKDRVAIVVYAGSSGLVLPSTSCDNKQAILDSLNRLEAGGSTNGGAGIHLAYKVARDNFIKGGSNRVILCSDGDFNVGTTDNGELIRLVQEKAENNIFLTVLGFGRGNLKDSKMEQIADKGHGNYAYIDNLDEARKVMVEQFTGTLITIAKDVKIQVEFNPSTVTAYRLLGYENRALKNEEFNDDKKMGGDIGAGHTVTAIYEVVPVGKKINLPGVDELKYQTKGSPTEAARSGELLTVKLRYKEPEGDKSSLLELPVKDSNVDFDRASEDLRFAASAAAFGMILRDSPYKGSATLPWVLEQVDQARQVDPNQHRAEFATLVKKAQELKK